MKFIYLIQSDKSKMPYSIPNGSEMLFLQWKDDFFPQKDSFHYPNSTFASGRNELLERAKKKGDYDYYVFLDDDLKLFFSLEMFEEVMTKLNCKRAIPYRLLGNKWYHFAKGDMESVKYVDHAFMAFRKDCLDNTFPYPLNYDKINWWVTCEKFCETFWNEHPYETVRINNLIFLNEEHREYPKENYQSLPENIATPYL